MRDKGAPGDTYNYKEHVYADPVALNLRKDQENEEETDTSKVGNVKKYQKPSSPPPVPNGPREARGPGGTSGLYAELPKKTNVPPRVSVRDLGSRFGGTVKRAQRDESAASVVNEEPPPPPLPEVTDSRNILDESPPGSPAKISNTDNQLVPNIPTDENDGNSDGEVLEPSVSDPSRAVSGELLADSDEEVSPGLATSEQGVLDDEKRDAPSPIDPNEVIIDVRINSEAGIEIGAELPVAVTDSTAGPEGETEAENGDGIRLIKSIKHDPFALEDGNKSGPGPAPVAAGAKPQERSSETSSASSGSVKRKKKKDVESGLNIDGHLRRNLIIASLFLLIILIIVSVIVVVLLKYPDVL